MEREARDWADGTAHRRVLLEKAKDMQASAIIARKEAERRASDETAKRILADQALRRATEIATAEARKAAEANVEEVRRLTGTSNDPSFRHYVPPEVALPDWELERAKHEAKNAKADPARVAQLVRQIEAEQSATFSFLSGE